MKKLFVFLFSMPAIVVADFETLVITTEVVEQHIKIDNTQVVHMRAGRAQFGESRIIIEKNGKTFQFGMHPEGIASLLPIAFAGPATVKFQKAGPDDVLAYLTLEIIPNSFDPGKTVVVPGGTSGARIILESSTDLINWKSADPGIYSNPDENKFFRIRAERLLVNQE